MSGPFAVDSSPPGFIKQYTQATKKDEGATDSPTYGLISAVFSVGRRLQTLPIIS